MNEELANELEQAFEGQFMQPYISSLQEWIEADTVDGIYYFPLSDWSLSQVEEHLECDTTDLSVIKGYGARLSANGYLDSTDWCVFKKPEQAAKYLLDTYAE